MSGLRNVRTSSGRPVGLWYGAAGHFCRCHAFSAQCVNKVFDNSTVSLEAIANAASIAPHPHPHPNPQPPTPNYLMSSVNISLLLPAPGSRLPQQLEQTGLRPADTGLACHLAQDSNVTLTFGVT
jgi:hypothetical protein